MTVYDTTPEWNAALGRVRKDYISEAIAEAEAKLKGKKLKGQKMREAVSLGEGRALAYAAKQETIDGVPNPTWDDPEWGHNASRTTTSDIVEDIADLITFLEEQDWSDFATSLVGQYKRTGSLSSKQIASGRKMQATMAAKAEAKKAEKPAIKTTALDLSDLPSGYYAVPNGDTRLKVRVARPTAASKWHGWIFVSDGAEYGARKNYGKQAPNGKYRGDIAEALEAIMANPFEATVAYGRLTGTCGACGRILEDESSIAAGIGPICAQKF